MSLASSALDFAFPQDVGAAAFGVVGAGVLVKSIDLLKKSGVMDQTLSRKLVHILSGPGFIASWALFSSQPGARVIAIAAPVLNLIRLVAIGSGQLRNEDAVQSISRSGDKSELLRGPLFYVIVLIVCTLFFWRESPTGIVALSMMCGGDGLADVVGRRWGKGNKLPFNPDKSFAGSLAMFLGGLGMSLMFLSAFTSLGYMSGELPMAVVAAICLAATVVEALPVSSALDDNITVPSTVLLLGALLL